MKIEGVTFLHDETSYERTIPFEVETDKGTFEGTLVVIEASVGGGLLDPETEITWSEELPDKVNQKELEERVLKSFEEEPDPPEAK